MQVIAHARSIRMSARKVRLVINLIRGMEIKRAQTQLRFANKAAATPVLKLLNSAVANATHNFQLDEKKLFIKSIMANEGSTLKRFHPRAHGRAMPIRKRSTHISIILEEVEPKDLQKKPVSLKKITSKTK